MNETEKAANNSKIYSEGALRRDPARIEYLASACETIKQGESNSLIVIGKTSAGPVGYGNPAVKNINASSIVCAAGVGTALKNSQVPQDAKVQFSPNFYYESAVIYISEQTDIDEDFNYGGRTKVYDSSAIALKADELRMFSRGEIRLVTGMDKNDSPVPGGPNHSNRDNVGISLIANNNDVDLQFMVKGDNLLDFLTKVLDEMKRMYGKIVEGFDAQSLINEAVSKHTHMSDFTTLPLVPYTDPNLNALMETGQKLINQMQNNIKTTRTNHIENLRNNYLSKNSTKYINSSFNKVN